MVETTAAAMEPMSVALRAGRMVVQKVVPKELLSVERLVGWRVGLMVSRTVDSKVEWLVALMAAPMAHLKVEKLVEK